MIANGIMKLLTCPCKENMRSIHVSASSFVVSSVAGYEAVEENYGRKSEHLSATSKFAYIYVYIKQVTMDNRGSCGLIIT